VLTATSTFIAAIAAGQRRDLKHDVRLDWLRDYVGDGDFETGIGGWTAAGSAACVVAPVSEPGQPGAWSAQVDWPTGGFFPQFARILTGLTIGQQYRTTARVYVPTGSPTVVLDATDGSTTTNGFPGGAADTWSSADHIWTATATTMTIRVNPSTGTTAGQRVWCDKVRVTVYPDTLADLTRYITQIVIDASITSDLPEQTRLVTGYSAAQATLSCAGVDPIDSQWRTLSWLISPANPAGPLYRQPKAGANLRVQLGVVGDAGAEYLPAFTGPVRLPMTIAKERRVEIQSLDPASRLTKRVALPQVTANDLQGNSVLRCGLNSQWVVDFILRQNGIYSCPPPRVGCAYSATMHGSTWPEVGTITSSALYRDDDGDGTPEVVAERPPFIQMTYGLGISNAGQGSGAFVRTDATLASTIQTGSGFGLLYDAVVERSVQAVDGWSLELRSAVSAGKQNVITVSASSATAWKPKIVWNDGTTMTTVAATTVTVPTGLSRLQVLATYTSNTVQSVIFQVDATTETVAGAAPYPADAVLHALVSCRVQASNGLEAVQFCQAPSGVIPQLRFFQPAAVLEAGLNELQVMPLVTDDPWPTLQDIAKAEAAVCIFAQTGVVQFWNRRHWYLATAAATVQDTLTTATSLKAVTIEESTDGLRNHIRVTTTPRVVHPPGIVWQIEGLHGMNPHQTITIWAKFATPVIGLSTTFGIIPGGGVVTGSAYRAAKRPAGGGGAVTNLQFVVTPFADSAKVVVTNPNGYVVYLVSPSGVGYPAASDGKPSMLLYGSPITDASDSTDTTTSAGSSAYVAEAMTPEVTAGTTPDRLYEAPTSVWMQDSDSADSLALDLLSALAAPPPLIRDVEVVGDPRRSLGDRVQLVDPDGLSLNDPAWLIGLRTTYGPAGLTQSATLRLVARFGQWILGLAGRDELGLNTYT
jgi:hypothetical protein